MNWLLVAVSVIFLVCIIAGLVKGAVRIAVSLATALLTYIIVFFAVPYVAKAITEFTPVDEMIKSQVSSAIAEAAATQLAGGTENGLTEDSVRKALRAAGVDEEALAEYGIKIEDIVNGDVSKDQLSKYGISGNVLDGLNSKKQEVQESIEETEIPRDMQIAAIQNADIPDIFKSLLTTNNNSEIYKQLGAETFAQYVGSYLAKMIINIIAFLSTFLLVSIVFRAVIFALDIVAELPGLGMINHLLGGVVGMIGALIIVWTLYVAITLLFTTAVGRDMFRMIQESGFLKLLYEYNPVMKIATMFR